MKLFQQNHNPDSVNFVYLTYDNDKQRLVHFTSDIIRYCNFFIFLYYLLEYLLLYIGSFEYHSILKYQGCSSNHIS